MDKEIEKVKKDLECHEDEDKEMHAKINENFANFNLALYGNERLGVKGMIKKVDELYDIFTAGGTVKKAVIFIIGTITATIGIAYTIIKTWKELR